MTAIDELNQQIADPVLHERIRTGVKNLTELKRFGLVFKNAIHMHPRFCEMPVKASNCLEPGRFLRLAENEQHGDR